jgi:hypothetical protein
MTIEKFVVRLLDAEHHLLAWTTVWAAVTPRGGGRSCQFWPTGPTQFTVTEAGDAAWLTIHWCDPDLARMTALSPQRLEVGQVVNFCWIEPVWLVPGMQNVPLPPVTVHQHTTLGVPTGTLATVAG